MDARYLMVIGIILLFAGIVFMIISSFLMAGKEDAKTDVAVAGVIGFIPFGFGTNKKLVMITVLIAVMIFIIFFLMRYLR